MSCSLALARRWISGIFSGWIAGNRKVVCGGGGVRSGEAPWLMLHPNASSEPVFKFWCCAKDDIYSFFPNEHKMGGSPSLAIINPAGWKLELVGSSQGWLALYDRNNRRMYLVDPITRRDIELPPLTETMCGEEVHSVILSDDVDVDVDVDVESEGKVFMIFGSGHRLAYSCGNRRGWTLLGDEAAAYDSAVYSSTHRRLFCIITSTSTTTLKLEAWDVRGDSPRLDNDWTTEFDRPEDNDNDNGEPEMRKLKYIVSEEQSGELFVAVRLVKHGGGRICRVGNRGPTVGFEVYKIDREGRRLMKMEDSLGGLAIFVGNNHPIAIKQDDYAYRHRGKVKCNSIYFAIDNRVRDIDVDANDNGIFDYQKGLFSPLSVSHPLGYPLWFTPRPPPPPQYLIM